MEKSSEEILYFIGATTVVIALFVITIMSLLLVSRNRRLKYINVLLKKDAEFLEKLNLTKLEVMEQVFADVSVDLHDNLGQTLTLAILKLNEIETDNSIQINETQGILRHALREMREVTHMLNRDYWKQFSLGESLKILENQISRLRGINISFKINDTTAIEREKTDLEKNNEILVFRVIQELINNSLKHSKADLISLKIEYEIGQLKLLYKDNGVGLKYPTSDKSSGLGMSSIKTRMNLCKAEFEIKDTNGSGFTFQATIPI